MHSTLTLNQNVPLAPHTTLGVGGAAAWFVEVASIEMVMSAVAYAKAHQLPFVVLGGGSNVLVPDAGYLGLIIKMNITGIREVATSRDTVTITVGAGVSLDTLVAYTVERGWWGLENLSAIPGTVGATPVQNVGAYGVEVADCIESVEVFDGMTDTVCLLSNHDCRFGYRTSLFKEFPSRYIITAVTFTLSLLPRPQCEYADLRQYFGAGATPSLLAVRQAVQAIRAQKFPDWTVVGTAGSFFKNPIIPSALAQPLLQKFPDLPQYPAGDGMIKLSLGYILDKICGLKGYSNGLVGLYEKQALVVVVERGASARAVMAFADEIIKKVFLQTGIVVEREVTQL